MTLKLRLTPSGCRTYCVPASQTCMHICLLQRQTPNVVRGPDVRVLGFSSAAVPASRPRQRYVAGSGPACVRLYQANHAAIRGYAACGQNHSTSDASVNSQHITSVCGLR